MLCNYCGKEAKLVSSKDFYGKDYGSNVWSCRPCSAYVGTHGRSEAPLGTLAKPYLRDLRKEAHSLFDPVWKNGKVSRRNAYKWLAKAMNVPPNKAHIGMFDEEQCKKLINIIKNIQKRNKDRLENLSNT